MRFTHLASTIGAAGLFPCSSVRLDTFNHSDSTTTLLQLREKVASQFPGSSASDIDKIISSLIFDLSPTASSEVLNHEGTKHLEMMVEENLDVDSADGEHDPIGNLYDDDLDIVEKQNVQDNHDQIARESHQNIVSKIVNQPNTDGVSHGENISDSGGAVSRVNVDGVGAVQKGGAESSISSAVDKDISDSNNNAGNRASGKRSDDDAVVDNALGSIFGQSEKSKSTVGTSANNKNDVQNGKDDTDRKFKVTKSKYSVKIKKPKRAEPKTAVVSTVKVDGGGTEKKYLEKESSKHLVADRTASGNFVDREQSDSYVPKVESGIAAEQKPVEQNRLEVQQKALEAKLDQQDSKLDEVVAAIRNFTRQNITSATSPQQQSDFTHIQQKNPPHATDEADEIGESSDEDEYFPSHGILIVDGLPEITIPLSRSSRPKGKMRLQKNSKSTSTSSSSKSDDLVTNTDTGIAQKISEREFSDLTDSNTRQDSKINDISVEMSTSELRQIDHDASLKSSAAVKNTTVVAATKRSKLMRLAHKMVPTTDAVSTLLDMVYHGTISLGDGEVLASQRTPTVLDLDAIFWPAAAAYGVVFFSLWFLTYCWPYIEWTIAAMQISMP